MAIIRATRSSASVVKPPGTRSSKREIELDFVRGIAILMVLHFHASSANVFVYPLPWLPLINFGWAGVDLFFVLSGFLVGGLMCKEWLKTGTFDPRRFLKRRAFKIWPGYYALIAGYIITRKQPFHTYFWHNVLNVQNYLGTSIAHTWSLAVEEHFYILLSIAIWWCASRKIPVRRVFGGLLMVAGLAASYRTFLAVTGKPYFFQTHTRIDGLLLGVMLAITFHFRHDRFLAIQRKKHLLGLVLIAAIVVLFSCRQFNRNGVQIIAADLGSAAFLLLAYKRANKGRGLLYRTVASIGVYSYGIYLWHGSPATPSHVLAGRLGLPWLEYPVRMALAIVLGIVMSKIIEFPFLRLRDAIVPATTGSNDFRRNLAATPETAGPERLETVGTA